MRVKLVHSTPDPFKLIVDIASICYGKEEASNPDKLMKHLYNNGHHSTFEHVHFIFKIEGISRICLAQLTRHRHASYTVRSQRYCQEEDTEIRIPTEGLDTIEQHDLVKKAYKDALESYKVLISSGVKKEDARFVLPQGTTTELYMSFNLRELLLIGELRTSKKAQWEIRDLVTEIVRQVLLAAPELGFMLDNYTIQL